MDKLAYQQFLDLEKTHWWFIGRRAIFFSLLDKFLTEKKDLLILDVGCGFGGMLDGLSRLGHAMGIEIDMESAKVCRDRGFNGICLGSGYDLPIQDNSLDLITLFDAIEHIEDDVKVLRQCVTALKPGGHIMITTPAYQFLFADNDRISHHLRRYTLSGLKRLVSTAGMEVIKGTYFNVILFPLILPTVMLLKIKQALRGPIPENETASTNLSYKYPRLLSFLLRTILCSEQHFLRRISMPFGHSIALIARKPL